MTPSELTEPAPAPIQEWVAPQVECYETRPEVTAYAGGDGPWANH